MVANLAWRSSACRNFFLGIGLFNSPRSKGLAIRAIQLRGSALALILSAICAMAHAQTIQSGSSQAGTLQAADTRPSTDQNTPALQERYPRYRVMPSDVMAISFPLSPEINQSVTVQPDGFITLPNVGSVYVQGQTTPQVVDTLTKAYSKILHNPIIGVDLTNFQAPQFTVLGQVGRPGQYQLRYDTTVSQAIAIGGGFLPSAKTQVFLLHRVSPDWVEVKKLNIKDVVHGKKASEDIHLQPGDMIFVPETVIAKFRRYLPYNTGVGVNPQALAR
jgi:polysaccharide biosynthesis/export protein